MAFPVGDSYGVASGGVISAGRTYLSPFWRDLPSGWTEISLTGTKPPAGILAYSGMALDSAGGKLYLQGGGHNDYSGEDVWELDLESRTQWVQHQTPIIYSAIPLAEARALVDNFNYPGAIVSGGSPIRPVSRHTYKSVHWIDSIKKMAVGGGSAYSGAMEYLWYWEGTGDGAWWGDPLDYWNYDPVSKTWAYKGSNRLSSSYDTFGSQHIYAPDFDTLYAIAHDENNNLKIGSWNHTTNTWGTLAVAAGATYTQFLYCYDSKRSKIVIFFRNAAAGTAPRLIEYSPASNSFNELAFSGAYPTDFYMESGMAYSESTDSVLVLLNGASMLYKMNRASSVWTTESHSLPNMIQVGGRWIYDLKRGANLLVYADSANVRVFAYKEG